MAHGINRVIVVVLDGVGAGELPDAADYGDTGSDTLGNLSRAVGGLNLPTFGRLGLGNLWPVAGVPPADQPLGCFGRMKERSPGKDSVTGHWEMMGIVLERPFPTYPNGFPAELMTAIEAAIGRETLGNFASSGTEVIANLGDEHVRTGKPIVYTSADSVFQIAAHEAIIPPDELYSICLKARELLTGKHEVGRVIARPFEGSTGNYRRTERRKDFPLEPPQNLIDELHEGGKATHAIGKISEFFNGRGIDQWDNTTNNADHSTALLNATRNSDASFIFSNFEDFDMLYGHRNDTAGFARALEEFDSALPDVLSTMKDGDLLILTNDHGNDPTTPSTDHSREHAFLLCYGPGLKSGVALVERESFADIAATIRNIFGMSEGANGRSFLNELVHNC
jgi:phosphopentomutase